MICLKTVEKRLFFFHQNETNNIKTVSTTLRDFLLMEACFAPKMMATMGPPALPSFLPLHLPSCPFLSLPPPSLLLFFSPSFRSPSFPPLSTVYLRPFSLSLVFSLPLSLQKEHLIPNQKKSHESPLCKIK